MFEIVRWLLFLPFLSKSIVSLPLFRAYIFATKSFHFIICLYNYIPECEVIIFIYLLFIIDSLVPVLCSILKKLPSIPGVRSVQDYIYTVLYIAAVKSTSLILTN
jgi:hypothetical protein